MTVLRSITNNQDTMVQTVGDAAGFMVDTTGVELAIMLKKNVLVLRI
jgi:hypothetical protein